MAAITATPQVRTGGASVTLERVTLDFAGGVRAIQDVDLAIPAGRFVSIVGTSGCGKSTVLNMVAGFLRPSSGRVLIDGASAKSPGPDRGMVFQQDAVFPWFSVAENIGYPMRFGKLTKPQRVSEAARLAHLVGLGHRLDALPKELSGGMRKRVDIARALAEQPAVLLMDEPFGALDAFTRVTLQNEFLTIWDQRRPTVLFVTHDVEEALLLSDEVVVMAGQPGRVLLHEKVPFSRPRSAQLRASVELQRLRAEITSALDLTPAA